MKLLTLLILLAFIPATSAYTITGMTITPSNNIVADDSISLSFTITPIPYFSSDYHRYSANPNNTIQIITALNNPVWIRNTVLNGAESQQTTSNTDTLILRGWDLAYRIYEADDHGETINITLTGTAPNVTSTGTVPFLTINEYDLYGIRIPGSDQIFQKVVINNKDLSSALYLAQEDITRFNTDIAEKEKLDIDTSAEKSMSDSAITSLAIAKELPPAQYELALSRLKDIHIVITGGEKTLDRAWAAQEINRAAIPLTNLDKIMMWFRDNSTMDYPGLKKIIDNQNNATTLLNAGSAAMNTGDYNIARSDARSAFEIANWTVYDAAALQKKAMDPLTPIWDNWFIIIITLVIGGIILLFKPKKKKVKKTEEK